MPVSEEPPDIVSFCEYVNTSDFSDPGVYHNIFTKLIATSDIVSADSFDQMSLQIVCGYQYILFFI